MIDKPEADHARIEALERELLSLQQSLETVKGERDQWRPIETAPKDGTPFLVTWAPSRIGGRETCVEMVSGWDEYQEVRGYGEPEAYGWYPLPRALASPMLDEPTTSALLRERPQEPPPPTAQISSSRIHTEEQFGGVLPNRGDRE